MHRLWNAGDHRELPEREVVAVCVLGPVEALRERLVVGRDRALDWRGLIGLEIADPAVAVQVEVGERLAGDVFAVADQILIDAVHVRAGGDRVLQLCAGLETERPDEVVDAGAGLKILLLHRYLLDERIRVLYEPEDVEAGMLIENVVGPAHAERLFAAIVGTDDSLDESLLVREVAAHLRPPGFRHHVHVSADGSHAVNRRRGSLDDLDAVHAFQFRARVSLHVDALHSAVIVVRLHVTDVDSSLQAITRRRVNAWNRFHEVLHGGDSHEAQLLVAHE